MKNELEEVRVQYEIIEEAAGDAIVTVDEQGRILSISRAAERIFGFPLSEMAGEPIESLVPGFRKHMAGSRQRTAAARMVEVVGKHKSGKDIQLELSLGEYHGNNRRVFTGVMRDIRQRKDTDRRLAAQYAVTRALAESSSLAEATPRLLGYVCKALGWKLGELWSVNLESNTLHIEGSWRVPSFEAEQFENAGRKTVLFPGIDLAGRVFASGEPAWISDVVNDSNFPRGPIAARTGLHGAFAFPIPVDNITNCVMAFYSSEIVQPDDRMMQMFSVLGSQVGDFVKRTRVEEQRDLLLINERVARSGAESNAEKLAFLGEASAVLASSLDYQTNLLSLAKLAVTRMADWCAVDIVDDEHGFHRVALVHRDPARLEWVREFEKRLPKRSSAPHGVAQVIQTGKSKIYTDVPESMLIAPSRDMEDFRMEPEPEIASAMVVLLVARGRTLGAITLASESPSRTYTEDDLRFAGELARSAALGIDNARLYSAAQTALSEVKAKTDEIGRLNGELEQRVRDRTAQLEMTVSDLEAFTHSISDDIRGPLRAIDGFSRVLIEEYPEKLDAEGGRLLNIIRDSARTMNELIDGLLAFSQLGRRPLEQTDVDMEDLARGVFDNVQTNEKDRPIAFQLHRLPTAFGDRGMIRDVLLALISNAFKFTRPRSNPVIEVGHKERSGSQHVYYVRDNGVGFDMQYRDKLFGVFQRLHRADEFEGAGVGLALVQRILLRHSGRVWAESKLDSGSTFYFSLPAAEIT